MKIKKSIKLSMYLLKTNTSPKASLKKKYQSKLVDYDQQKKWKIIVDNKQNYKPAWAKYLNIQANVSSASAILFIEHTKRWFALCFGYGHNMLDTNKLTRNFGLITTLNMLDKNKIKSSDIFAPSDHSKQKRTQTVLDSNLQGHDIDGFSHILKSITGKTLKKYKHLSKIISASNDSIKINTGKLAIELAELCSEMYQIYQKTDYKDNFPEAFHITPVKDENMKQVLFKQLLSKLNNQSLSVCLEVPELIDFQDISKFRINIKDRKKHFINNLDISAFYKIQSPIIENNNITLENLKQWELILIDNNDNNKISFSLLKCLIFDCQLKNNNYHFSNGQWYMLEQKFSIQLENYIAPLKKNDIDGKPIPQYIHRNEAEYNKYLAKKLNAYLLDNHCITMGGYDKIEPCDVFFIANKQKNIFIHVKIQHGGSSSLSHLFLQGDISLTLLNTKNSKFINGIKEKVKNFNPKLTNVVYYLILSKNKSIPLFAKVSLFKIIHNIRSKGGEVFWSIKDKRVGMTKTKPSTGIQKRQVQPRNFFELPPTPI